MAKATNKKQAAQSETRLVRIHPYNPIQGYTARTYLLSGSGYPKFDVTRGWYEVDIKTANYLAKVRNDAGNEFSKPVFQICTFEEAMALKIAEEQKAAEPDAPVPMPNVVRRRLKPKQKHTPALQAPEHLRNQKSRSLAALNDDVEEDEDDDLPEALEDDDDLWDEAAETDENDDLADEAVETAEDDEDEDSAPESDPAPKPARKARRAPQKAAKKTSKKATKKKAAKKKTSRRSRS